MKLVNSHKHIHLDDLHDIPDGVFAALLNLNDHDMCYLEDILSQLPEDNFEFICVSDKDFETQLHHNKFVDHLRFTLGGIR